MNCTHLGCRVEVFYQNTWVSVKGIWLNASAEVACRSLGSHGWPVSCGTGLCGTVVSDPAFVPATGRVWLCNVSCSGWETKILDCPSNLIFNVSFSKSGDKKWCYYDSSGSAASSKDAGVCCWPLPAFVQHTGLRTQQQYGHVFKTISHLDRSGDEVVPDVCCQDDAGVCINGAMMNDVTYPAKWGAIYRGRRLANALMPADISKFLLSQKCHAILTRQTLTKRRI